VAESVPEAKVIAAFFGKSHFSDGHDGIPEHLRHNGGNPLKYQDHHVRFRALPLKAMECAHGLWRSR
jgi:hypothetical protein